MGQYIGCCAYMLAALLDINIKGFVFAAEKKRVANDLLCNTMNDEIMNRINIQLNII